MTKFSLTITADSAAEIVAFLSGVPGSAVQIGTPSAAMAQYSAAPMQNDDDNAPLNTAAPSVDTRQMPHDPRIHSASKSTNADGTWRKRKGVSDATIAAVEAELKGGMQTAPQYSQPGPQFPVQPQQFVQPVQPQQFVQPVQPQQFVQPVQPQQFVPQADQPQFVQPVQPAPVQPAPVTQPDFPMILRVLQDRMQSQNGQPPLVTMDYLTQLCGRIGQSIGRQISNITELQNDPQGIATAVQIMQLDGKW